MERFKTWAFRIGCAAVTAGALLSRDACLGGSRPPPPDPKSSPAVTGEPTATAAPPAATATAPATAAEPSPSGKFATPP